MFLIGLIFFICFCSNLSISSIDKIIGLKNRSIACLIFTSLSFNFLSFNSIKSFSNSKNFIFAFKNGSFSYFLIIFYHYFCFYSLGFPSLYINKKFLKNLKMENIIFKSDFLSDFKWSSILIYSRKIFDKC